MNADIWTCTPDTFPALLPEIDDAPEKLYVRGSLPDPHSTFLSVVGSRKYTSYGASVCQHLIESLAGTDVVIVSGLALGIDGLAHNAALKTGLTTIAIPGSGLDPSVLYPASHQGLGDTIIERGGALLSEYEPTLKATPWSFPKRNRIMAGISHAVLVIEATEKSGTLITARLAYEYNRDVLAVPGSIFSASSHGPHALIRDGAVPISSGDDLREALNISPTSHITHATLEDCTDHEKLLLEALVEPRPRHELVDVTSLEVHEINIALSLLEIKGYITEDMGVIRKTPLI